MHVCGSVRSFVNQRNIVNRECSNPCYKLSVTAYPVFTPIRVPPSTLSYAHLLRIFRVVVKGGGEGQEREEEEEEEEGPR